MATLHRFDLYELAVQSPEEHADLFESICKQVTSRPIQKMREDFCGTFRISSAWVRRFPKRSAVVVDLDPAPLAFGKKKNAKLLEPSERSRIRVLRANVLTARTGRVDLTIGCNFSFFIFKTRAELLRYFRAVRAHTAPRGVFILEMAGGPGMIEKTREKKTVRFEGGRFGYVWDQQSFDPITRNGKFAIHFEAGGKKIRDAFIYDWRLWTIPEVREALIDAGFKSTKVFWETSHRGEGTGEFVRAESGDNSYAWICYVVGIA